MSLPPANLALQGRRVYWSMVTFIKEPSPLSNWRLDSPFASNRQMLSLAPPRIALRAVRAGGLRTIVAVCATWIMVIGAASNLAGQVPGSRPPRVPPGRLLGVFDEASGEPIAGAEVSNLSTGDHISTTSTGTVSLWFIDRPTIVQVRLMGYEPVRLVVDPTDTTPITIVLRRATPLPTVVTRASINISTDPGLREGFDRRCAVANVACVRDSTIGAHPNSTLGDLLIKLPGVLTSGSQVRMHANGPGLCAPTYYVDGFTWNTKALGPPIDQPGSAPGQSTRFSKDSPPPPYGTSNVARVEVYGSGAPRPTRFSGDGSCGVIAIWTR